MTAVRKSLAIPEDLIVADEMSFLDKASEHAAAGVGKMHAVFDFDRTLTIKRPGTHDEVTTWHIMREQLPPDGQAQYQHLFEKYRALELSGAMTKQDAVDWWSAILDLFVRHKIDLTAVEKTFLERASIRPGTKELFELLEDNDIPTVILSAGIREVIEIWCRKYGIKPSLIISTSLLTDSGNKVAGWQKDTLVHVLNKSETNHAELLTLRSARPKALLVGDSMDDAAMAAGEWDVMRVRVLDPRADEASNAHEAQRTFQKFDAFIQTGSLQPLVSLIDLIV